MKKIIVMLLMIAMVVVSCSAKASNDPKEVAKQFTEASFGGDIETLKGLVAKSEVETLEKMEDSLKELEKMNVKPEVTVTSIKEDGDQAEVEVSIKLKIKGFSQLQQQNGRVHLIIEDGKWVVYMLNSK